MKQSKDKMGSLYEKIIMRIYDETYRYAEFDTILCTLQNKCLYLGHKIESRCEKENLV